MTESPAPGHDTQLQDAPLEFDAVVLTGGRGSRLGGTSKAALRQGSERILDRVLTGLAGARQIVVVGPDEGLPTSVLVTREEPAGSGPCAGLVAGVHALAAANPKPAEWTMVLAVDLVAAGQAIDVLLRVAPGLPAAADGVCLRHADGFRQHLLGIHRTGPLRRAIADYGDPTNRSVRSLLDLLTIAERQVCDEVVADLDTPEDLVQWQINRPDPQAEQWHRFVTDVAVALDLHTTPLDPQTVLDLTREVAHAGARPMAPVVAFLLGRAAAQGRRLDADTVRRAVAAADALRPPVDPPEQETR